MKARPSVEKRRKEMARAERKRDKAARRVERRVQQSERTEEGEEGVDPDIADIVPGPQPLPHEQDAVGSHSDEGSSKGSQAR